MNYKNLLIKINGYKCWRCGLSDWLNQPITLERDHIDGNSSNNDMSNLRLLCPNCHSQTDTFRGRNINHNSRKVTDEDFIEALNNTDNIRQALIRLGLAGKGGNYKRASRLINIQPPTINTKNSQFGTTWINNDIHNKKIKKVLLPEYIAQGWGHGRIVTTKPPSPKGKIWITNGIVTRMILSNITIPNNWWRGRC